MPVLTAASVHKYTPNTKRREIPDAKSTGLYLVIQPKPSGAKSWALRFRRPSGKPAKLTLGPVDLATSETRDDPVIGAPLTLGQARVLAAQIARKRERGIDVVAEHKATEERKATTAADLAANTFGKCSREFFANYKTRKHKQRPRRWRDDAILLGLRYPQGCDPASTEPEVIKGGLADTWRDKPVASIDGHDIHQAIVEGRKLGRDGRARKLHVALSAMFRWLLEHRRVSSNPASGVWRPGAPPARERVLTNAEIASFWKACTEIGPPYGNLFQLLLLTGCRLREAANMQHSELDDGVWTIPGSRTKNHKTHTLALPPLALQVISSVPKISGNFVFTISGRHGVSGFSKAKDQLDQAMPPSTSAWRLHDLRRTTASGMAALKIELPVIEKVLNHQSGSFAGVVGVYQRHEFSDEKKEALQRWAQQVQGLLEGRANVVAMRR